MGHDDLERFIRKLQTEGYEVTEVDSGGHGRLFRAVPLHPVSEAEPAPQGTPEK